MSIAPRSGASPTSPSDEAAAATPLARAEAARAESAPPPPRESVLMRWPLLPYNLLVLSLSLAVAATPVLLVSSLTGDSLLGVGLIPVLAWYLGLLLLGGVYAVQGQDLLTDAHLLRRLLHGVHGGLREAAGIWLPTGVVIALAVAPSAFGVPTLLPLLLAGAVTVLALLGTSLAARFRFRLRDLWRLAAAAGALRPASAIGVLCLLGLLVGVTVTAGDATALLLLGPLAVLLERTTVPLAATVRERHTTDRPHHPTPEEI